MVRALERLEGFLEEAVEGTVQRVFRPKLQPVQLARGAARSMERLQIVGPYGPEVPNAYRIALHPRDFEKFAKYRGALERELEKYLTKYAGDRAWRPVAEVAVRIVELGEVSPGRPRLEAEFSDLGQAGLTEAERESRRLPAETTTVRRGGVRSGSDTVGVVGSPGVLIGEGGERFELYQAVTTLGRALENDIVIADGRVSRVHAEIRREAGGYLVRDLGSTNGTRLADRPIEQGVARHGDAISLGGYRLTLSER